jgi:hypothetical protein
MEINSLRVSLPIIEETIGQGIAKVYEKSQGTNTLNILITPNSRLARLYADAFSSKVPKSSLVLFGLASHKVPKDIQRRMFESIGQGQIHYVIGSANVLLSAFEKYQMKVPLPLYLLESDSSLNLWLVEPLNPDFHLGKALMLCQLTKGGFFNISPPNHNVYPIISMQMIQPNLAPTLGLSIEEARKIVFLGSSTSPDVKTAITKSFMDRLQKVKQEL